MLDTHSNIVVCKRIWSNFDCMWRWRFLNVANYYRNQKSATYNQQKTNAWAQHSVSDRCSVVYKRIQCNFEFFPSQCFTNGWIEMRRGGHQSKDLKRTLREHQSVKSITTQYFQASASNLQLVQWTLQCQRPGFQARIPGLPRSRRWWLSMHGSTFPWRWNQLCK